MKKWAARILIGILTGLTVWFLTQSPYSPFVSPDVELTAPVVPDGIIAGEEFLVAFRATNQHGKQVSDCSGFVSLAPVEIIGLERRVEPARCRTQTSNFNLGGPSPSSVEVLTLCATRNDGIFSMEYGITCRNGQDSDWQVAHITHIEVEPGESSGR